MFFPSSPTFLDITSLCAQMNEKKTRKRCRKNRTALKLSKTSGFWAPELELWSEWGKDGVPCEMTDRMSAGSRTYGRPSHRCEQYVGGLRGPS